MDSKQRKKFSLTKKILVGVVALLVISICYFGFGQWNKQRVTSNLEIANAEVVSDPQLYSNDTENVDNEMSISELLALQKEAIDKGIQKQAAGHISIPALDVTLPIFRGANQYTLSLGAATFYYDDATMGEGNFVLAGHNVYQKKVMFSDIHNLVKGDAIDLIGNDQVYRYRVTKMFVAPDTVEFINGVPSAGSLLEKPAKGEKAIVTLFTCIYVNNVKERYVVQGELSELLPKQ